jgi:hypothetical protein
MNAEWAVAPNSAFGFVCRAGHHLRVSANRLDELPALFVKEGAQRNGSGNV